MAVQVQLNDGSKLRVELDLDQMRQAYETALRNDTILEVMNGEGKTRAVNPMHIVSFEEIDQVTPAASARAEAEPHR